MGWSMSHCPDTDWMFNAPDYVVRSVLVALCENSISRSGPKSCCRSLRGRISWVKSVMETKKAAAAGLKVEVEVECDEPFDPSDNHHRTCVFHPGELECDWYSEEWADWDENCHGPIDTKENRLDYPNGFTWDCCDRPGSRRGCTRGRHQESNTLKRLRASGVIRTAALPKPTRPYLYGGMHEATRIARTQSSSDRGTLNNTLLSLDASQRPAMEEAVRQAQACRQAEEDGDVSVHTISSDSSEGDVTTGDDEDLSDI
ncbi:hypothetical protein F5Y17DRAFT_463203 [Xylariaceae sp. FL0594]|nr:hypothetical protein F5Y17DRAFT_463203 [Xylariaceae sp. FL0594]